MIDLMDVGAVTVLSVTSAALLCEAFISHRHMLKGCGLCCRSPNRSLKEQQLGSVCLALTVPFVGV